MPQTNGFQRFGAWRALAFALAALLVGACVPEANDAVVDNVAEGEANDRVSQNDIPLFLSMPDELLPLHAKTVVAALAMGLRGASEKEIAEALSVDGLTDVFQEPDFTYQGFALRQVKLAQTRPLENGILGFGGFLHFEDTAGRRTALAFDVDYRVEGDRIAMTRSAALPIFPRRPETEMYIAPLAAVEAAFDRVSSSYAGFYELVLSEAVPLSRAGATPDGEGEYLIVVFFKDRVSPDGQFSINVGSKRDGVDGDSSAALYTQYDGWPVGIIGGRFALDGEETFWVKAVYAPGSEVAESQRRPAVVGLFSSRPGAAAGS